jgi:hypothetical protein
LRGVNRLDEILISDERMLQIQACMYQYSRAIYRSIKDLVDPYVDPETRLEYRRQVLDACEQTMERLATDPLYFAKPERALFQDIRRYFPITSQAQVAWAVSEGVSAACAFIESQIEASRASGHRCPNVSTAPRTSTSRLALESPPRTHRVIHRLLAIRSRTCPMTLTS